MHGFCSELRVQARDGPGTGITRQLGDKLAAVPIQGPVALRLRIVDIAGIEVAVCLAKALAVQAPFGTDLFCPNE
jgi:hypothetical protein